MRKRSESGQALVELSVSVVIVFTILIAGARLLLGEWQSTRCTYLAFEAAHAELTGQLPGRELLRVSIQSDSGSVSARARCGDIEESVRLPRLEAKVQLEPAK